MTDRIVRIGVIGAGFMGKAHTLAIKAAPTVFPLSATPVAEMLATSSGESAARSAASLGFRRHTGDWRHLVADPKIDAVIICTPTFQHRPMALAAIEQGKHVLCEKPLALDTVEAREMTEAAERAGVVCLVGFNYAKSPAVRLARKLIDEGAIGEVIHFRGEHIEDFLADPSIPIDWRMRAETSGVAGALADVGSHVTNMAHYLCGPVAEVMAETRIVHARRPLADGSGDALVENDDQAEMLVRFASGVPGSLLACRVATGRKMGLTFEVTGTRGALRFDQERFGELEYYRGDDPAGVQGFRRILVGPDHPDYGHFCPAPGHGLGYNDMMTIEMRDLIEGIHGDRAVWPAFRDGAHVSEVVDAALESVRSGIWQPVG